MSGGLRDGDTETVYDPGLAGRVAEYLRGSLSFSANAGTAITTTERRAWFYVTANDGKKVRVTVEDQTDA